VKRNGIRLAVAAFVIGTLGGCGDDGSAMSGATAAGSPAQSQPPPPQVHAQSLDTLQLLEQARQASNTADPYLVNGGALRLTDTSDSSDPILVNAT
jgi:hypothetical protein